MPHIVRQLHLKVDLQGTEAEGMAMQRRLSELCHHWLIPAVEKALDRVSIPNGQHLSIDYLEIDAGILNSDQLEHDLVEAVAQALEKLIRQQLVEKQTTNTGNNGVVVHKTEQQTIQEAFVFFLQTGRLPWSFRLPTGKNLESALLDCWQEAQESSAHFYATNQDILRALAYQEVQKRLMQQFSSLFLNALLARLSPDSSQLVVRILEKLLLDYTIIISIDMQAFTQQVWQTVFDQIAAGNQLTEELLVGETVRHLSMSAVQKEVLFAFIQREWPNAILPDKRELLATKETKKLQSEGPKPGQEEAEMKEGIYLDNAGLVLLHPFLPRFFEGLGIAHEATLLLPERALCLLHYLATGQSIAPEYALTLLKILCSVPLQQPTKADVGLTEAEKEEVTALLNAVIRHWDALRNTTPDALRGTFLVRPGKLSIRDDGDWLLQVEPQAYDILLDQLPWGISMIQLPWMEQMLWVEWG